MIRDAATCDRPNCLAVYLEPDDRPEGQPFETALAAAGWRLGADGHACPACATGTGPVLERGECPRCCGSTVDRPAGATCHYCRHVQPFCGGDFLI
ncbi:hypothetical protein [Streptomyces mexicanus]|uniref:Uncharacterized protein n=1 Tax=Streptomyces mexicanus TaxID=178566 RepID=A0A7X1I6S0_9ACTN|nr:hypothetical protein [Streptomyces mexicanus]MBC2869822.1 hypothetical protein [Streptomyces mexicanus]